jgi:hypothetical protein
VEEKNPVLGNFQINLPGPNGASMSISGYIYGGESKESLDERMDLCRESLIRQQQSLEIPVLEEQLSQLDRQKEVVQKAYKDLLENKTSGKKLSSQDQAALSNYPQQLKFIQAEMDKGRAKIEAVKKVA